PLLDLSVDPDALGRVNLHTNPHKFATDAAFSGTNPAHSPTFGSSAFVGKQLVAKFDYGMPYIRMKRGTRPKLWLVNKNTGFTTNIHFHGLNTTADVDGASELVVFGDGTSIGPVLKLHFPTINNNSALLLYHSHAMFRESPFIQTG